VQNLNAAAPQYFQQLAARARRRQANWHRTMAADAEFDKDWFAAAFHLQWLVANDPADVALRARLEKVQAESADPGAAKAEKPTEVGEFLIRRAADPDIVAG
jgi:hypothetical protein